MRVALYLHKADGFGEWRILLGTRGAKKLREFRKRDIKKFKTVYKKIKELSNGQFLGDNQNRLDGTRLGVPIFEAYIERDLRLVYQIDCVPDHDGAIERQVIRIYGIYAHTQRDGVWDAMSHHLANKGEEYTQRYRMWSSSLHRRSSAIRKWTNCTPFSFSINTLPSLRPCSTV